MTAWSIARGWDRLVPAAILAALVLLALGLTLPVMSVDRFFVFTSAFSILESLEALYRANEYFLFAAVGLFSLVFPVAKLFACLALWCLVDTRGRAFHALLAWIEHLGRWSMLDVFLVAILLVMVRFAGVGRSRTEIGLYLFTAAVAVSIFTAQWIKGAVARLPR
jgi:paraquat-inducible protein A